MERITITLDERVLREIKRVAGPRGVSKFMNAAARKHLGRVELYGWLAEMDARHGKPSKKLREEIDRDMRKIFGL